MEILDHMQEMEWRRVIQVEILMEMEIVILVTMVGTIGEMETAILIVILVGIITVAATQEPHRTRLHRHLLLHLRHQPLPISQILSTTVFSISITVGIGKIT